MILEQFSLRSSSGGAGKHCGGDGVIRKLLFRDKVVLSVLTERRSTRPYGLQGKLSTAILSMHSFQSASLIYMLHFSSDGQAVKMEKQV